MGKIVNNKLLRNNLLALLLHVGLNLLVFAAFIYTKSSPAVVVLTPFVTVLYVLFGRAMSPQGSSLRNLLSVFVVSLIGILIWSYCYSISLQPGESGVSWIFYGMYIFWLMPLFDLVQMGAPDKWGILFSFVPSLLLWLGMEWKYRTESKVTKSE